MQLMTTSLTIQHLRSKYASLVPSLLDKLGAAFECLIRYAANRHDASYLQKLLAKEDVMHF